MINRYRTKLLLLISLLMMLNCKNYTHYDYSDIINSKIPKNSYIEIYKDFNFLKCCGIGLQDTNMSDLRSCFILYKDISTNELNSFLYLNSNGKVEIEMSNIHNKYFKIFAGENKILLRGFARKDTLLYLPNDTLIYNMTYTAERRYEKGVIDTEQYNLSIYNLEGDSNKLGVGFKLTSKNIFLKNLSPNYLSSEIKNNYFFKGLNYKSYFIKLNDKVSNTNFYSGKANGDRIEEDTWTKEFDHNGMFFYSMFKNYEVK